MERKEVCYNCRSFVIGQGGEPTCQLRNYSTDQLEAVVETQKQLPSNSPGKCPNINELIERLAEDKASKPLPPMNIMSGLNTEEAKARLRAIDKHLPTEDEISSIIYEIQENKR